MKKYLFAIYFILLSSVVYGSLMPNESLDEYEKRVSEEVVVIGKCGDDVCEGKEIETCLQDCITKEERIILRKAELNETTEEQGVEKNSERGLIFLVIVLSLLIIFIALFVYYKNRAERLKNIE